MPGNIGNVKTIVGSDGAVSITVASTGTVYTHSFRIPSGAFFGIAVIASATGTPDYKVELEQSYTPPATEGSSDGNWVTPDGISPIFAEIADSSIHIKTVSPVPMPYARFKLTGLNSNSSDTALTIKLFVQSEV